MIFPVSFFRCIKLITINNPSLKNELYDLAFNAGVDVENVHPGGRILEGVALRIAFTKLFFTTKQLYDEIHTLHDKFHNLVSFCSNSRITWLTLYYGGSSSEHKFSLRNFLLTLCCFCCKWFAKSYDRRLIHASNKKPLIYVRSEELLCYKVR